MKWWYLVDALSGTEYQQRRPKLASTAVLVASTLTSAVGNRVMMFSVWWFGLGFKYLTQKRRIEFEMLGLSRLQRVCTPGISRGVHLTHDEYTRKTLASQWGHTPASDSYEPSDLI